MVVTVKLVTKTITSEISRYKESQKNTPVRPMDS